MAEEGRLACRAQARRRAAPTAAAAALAGLSGGERASEREEHEWSKMADHVQVSKQETSPEETGKGCGCGAEGGERRQGRGAARRGGRPAGGKEGEG